MHPSKQQKKKDSPKNQDPKPSPKQSVKETPSPRKTRFREARVSLEEQELREHEDSDQDRGLKGLYVSHSQEIIHIDDDIPETPRTRIAKKIKDHPCTKA